MRTGQHKRESKQNNLKQIQRTECKHISTFTSCIFMSPALRNPWVWEACETKHKRGWRSSIPRTREKTTDTLVVVM